MVGPRPMLAPQGTGEDTVDNRVRWWTTERGAGGVTAKPPLAKKQLLSGDACQKRSFTLRAAACARRL